MLLIGLTGSIGMGKSETAKLFARLGIPVYDADAAIHALYDQGGKAVEAVEAAFPGVAREGRVDRAELSRRVTADPRAMDRLEEITHPLVLEARNEFLACAGKAGAKIAVLEIPLLYETGSDAHVDIVVVASAPHHLQRQRALARPGMTEEKLAVLLARQLPDDAKRAKADYIVDTGHGLEQAFAQVKTIVEDLKTHEGKIWNG